MLAFTIFIAVCIFLTGYYIFRKINNKAILMRLDDLQRKETRSLNWLCVNYTHQSHDGRIGGRRYEVPDGFLNLESKRSERGPRGRCQAIVLEFGWLMLNTCPLISLSSFALIPPNLLSTFSYIYIIRRYSDAVIILPWLT